MPYRTHGAILPHVSNTRPCEITLYKRFIKHFMMGYNHVNPVIADIFMSATFYNSRLHKNLKHVAAYCNTSYRTILKSDVQSNLIDKTWESSVAEHDVLNGRLVNEVCDMRDDWSNQFFDTDEINVLLEFLCTAFRNF